MKLKELHLRNIASIERADLDFENDLNDAITGEPVSIFLIAGDTGAGKSVILDGISMALYKKTPRTAGVANRKKNEFINDQGDTVKVTNIEQYTRLGISPHDECYSEVVFEGNDGQLYHARLTLGVSLGNTDKKTGLRPLRYKDSVWEVRIGNGDWTKDQVASTIHNAVGLTFEQFGRMAMLAQGQFAQFLTGDKKEREAILEQLTNTEHFTAYGEAIKSLYDKAQKAKSLVQAQYETEKPHTLTDEEVEQIEKEQQEGQKKKTELDGKIKVCDDRLKQTETVLSNEHTQKEAQEQKLAIENIIAGEDYQRQKALFTDWDATSTQRQQLNNLQKAQQEEKLAEEQLHQQNGIFVQLSADLAYRQAEAEKLKENILNNEQWLSGRKQHETLFARASETDLKIGQYLKNVTKAEKAAADLKKEQGKTESLNNALTEAVTKALEAGKAVQVKEEEIDSLNRKRAALNPQLVNDQISQKEAAKRRLGEISKANDDLETAIKDTDELRQDIKGEEETLKKLGKEKDEAEAFFQEKKAEADKADKRLNTMEMSLGQTLVALRRRLLDEHTETCPLCGQHIDHDLLDDDFREILMPLEKEQKEAAEALQQATDQRDRSRDAYNNLNGIHDGKKTQLANAEKKNAESKKQFEKKALEAGLDIEKPLAAQILEQSKSLNAEINKLRADQQEAERLQSDINSLLKAKKPLDNEKLQAEREKTMAENKVKTNASNIEQLEAQRKECVENCEEAKDEINELLAGYCDDWLKDIDAARQQLKADATEYNEHQKQLSADQTSQEQIATLLKSLSGVRKNILRSCPEWETAQEPQSYPSSDINGEWTTLLGLVTRFVTKRKESKATITECSEALDDYYQKSGKTEQALLTLIGQESQVAGARRFVSDTDAQLKSRTDAIAESQRQIDAAISALGIDDRSALPDKQTLTDEKKAVGESRDEVVKTLAQLESRLKSHWENVNRLREIEARLEEAEKRLNKWEKLNSIFGGTRFRTLVQSCILRPLLKNANIYLEQITDRYWLTCSDDNEQLSIFVLDRYNKNQIRSVTVLSGGERFMISLALSLALSSLNRPDMNVNILFIDEGFGTLDEKSLDSVMSTLEKLQDIAGQTNRRVGIISHREDLYERIGVKINVVKKGEGRSMIEVKHE
ncbi:MAG: SMC family ATPase [Prevotella sp.]|nr:SMC family ATPase [Prevotella sp.]